MNNIKGKTVVITGASSGFGAVTAKHLASLGAIEIPRARYRGLLADALSGVADLHSVPLETAPEAVLQRSTHTS